MRLIFNAMPICCHIHSVDLRIFDCNEAAIEFCGFESKQEYIENWFDMCMPKYQPDGRLSAERAREYVHKTLDSGSMQFEWTQQNLSGELVPCVVTLKRVMFRGENVILSFTEDMRPMKKMEATIAEAEMMTLAITETSPIAYIQCDKDLNPIDCNSEALRLFGCPNKKMFLEYYWDRMIPQKQPDGQNSLERVMALTSAADVGKRMVFEWHFQSLSGEPFPTELSLTKMEYKDENFIIVHVYDLRRTRKMEQSIIQLENEVSKIFYDPLTGIYNRRFLDENLRRVIKRLSRAESVLSLMMIDIDYFKKYNDTYGHVEGDNCLRRIAETLVNSVTRDGDFVARYGGEEFVVVLPNANGSGARIIAERMLENVRRHNIPHKSSSAADRVTISIGVITGKAKYMQNVNDYLKRADDVMYRSKQAGRDQYTFEAMD